MHFKSIQALRAIAAILVMAHHLTDGKFLGGAAGVDVFFVISGFIMGSVDSNIGPKQFLLKRLIRIIPLYWLMTFAMCFLATLGLLTNFRFDAFTLVASILFIPHVSQTGEIFPLVVPGWTLNMEMFFYLIFAFGLFFRNAALVAAGCLIAIVLAGQIAEPSNVQLKFLTMPILLEFVAGLALAGYVRPAGRALGVAVLAAGTVAFVVIDMTWRYTDALRPLAWGGPAFLVVCGALAIERAGAWPKRALVPLERIGDASYSLYLTHGIVIAAIHRKLGASLPINLMAGLLCLVVAFVVFHGFEKPTGRLLNRLLRGNQPTRAKTSTASLR